MCRELFGALGFPSIAASFAAPKRQTRREPGTQSHGTGRQDVITSQPGCRRSLMSFWNGSRWISDQPSRTSPGPSQVATWAATAVMVFGFGAVALPLQLIAASSQSTGGASASCTVSSLVLGGSPVIQVDAMGMRHSADYKIEWGEPAITQTEYMWST